MITGRIRVGTLCDLNCKIIEWLHHYKDNSVPNFRRYCVWLYFCENIEYHRDRFVRLWLSLEEKYRANKHQQICEMSDGEKHFANIRPLRKPRCLNLCFCIWLKICSFSGTLWHVLNLKLIIRTLHNLSPAYSLDLFRHISMFIEPLTIAPKKESLKFPRESADELYLGSGMAI